MDSRVGKDEAPSGGYELGAGGRMDEAATLLRVVCWLLMG